MTAFTWVIGIAITAWVGAMGVGALLRTKGANEWFGEMLKQSPNLMRINGLGLFITASLVGLNLVLPTVITGGFVKFAIIGIVISQLSTLFMQIRGSSSRAAMAGPSMLLILVVIYWFINT